MVVGALYGACHSGRSGLAEEFEVAFSRHSGGADVVFDDENRDGGVFRNDYRSENAWFGEYHVVAFYANASEAVCLKDSCQSLVGDRVKPWHVPAAAAGKFAGW